MSDYGELDYWQYDTSYDDSDDYDDDYDRFYSRNFSPQVPAYTTHVSKPPCSYVKDGRAHSHTHDESLGKHLYHMFLSSDHCDVTLLVGTSDIKAHRLVRMANSDYFNAMFSSTWSEARTSTISFQDNQYVTSNGLEAIVEYAYTGSFQVTESTVREILEAARHFLMPDVAELCEMFVRDVPINVGNVGLVFEMARDFGMEHVIGRCRDFAMIVRLNLDNLIDFLDCAQVSGSNEICCDVISFILRDLQLITTSAVCHELLDLMDADSLLAMVKEDTLCFFTDLLLIEFIMKWVERRENRAPFLPEVMAEINLLCFDEDTLDTIANMKLIRTDMKCRNLVAAAKEHLLDITNDTGRETDLYMVSAWSKSLKFVDITNQTVFEFNDVFSSSTLKLQDMPMHPHPTSFRNAPLLEGMSVLAVGDILFICSWPIEGTYGELLSLCCSFDPRLSRWTELPCLSGLTQYSYIQFLSVDGEVCAIDENFSACLMQMYNFCKDEWRVVQGRTPLANTLIVKAATINGHLYLLSKNKDAKWEFFSTYSYNPDCQLWQAKKTPFPDIRHGHIDQTSNLTPASPAGRDYFDYTRSLVVGEDCLYLFPSRADTLNFFNVEIYSPSADDHEWTTLRISQRITDLSVAPHAGQVYISASYRSVDSPRTKSPDSGIFILDLGGKSITFLTNTDFSRNFVMLNIPKTSVDMLRERSKRNKQRFECLYSFKDMFLTVGSVNVKDFGYLK